MIPNLDPKQLRSVMNRMGIKSNEIEAERVVIEGKEHDIVIENPQVTEIIAQGTRTFQVMGEVREIDKSKIEISEDDVKVVKEQTGINDDELIRKALEEARGDIAEAILRLKEEK